MGGYVVRGVSFLLLLTGIVTLAAACSEEPKDTTEEYLEFVSGGRYHPSGYGEWRVRLCGDGSIIADHIVGDTTESTNVFVPTRDETNRLFSLFCAVDIKHMKSSERPGVPDEVSYSFALKDGSGSYSRSVWINDAREDPAIRNLVAYVEQLVEKYTGKKPVMR
jgi:hypothetical protein